jgi:hypothetical protein
MARGTKSGWYQARQRKAIHAMSHVEAYSGKRDPIHCQANLIPEYAKGTKTPSARTKQMFESQGCDVVKLEKMIPRTFIKQDVWGADWLVRQGCQLLAVQVTDDTNHSKRVTKALESPKVKNWLECGVLFFVYSWGKKGPRGKSKMWTLRVTQLVMKGDKVTVL